MMKPFSLLAGVFLLFSGTALSQTTVFTQNFEGFANWQVSGATTPNTWITDACAGNGPSQPGSQAAYITSGGSVAGCGPAGTEHYGYADAPSGSNAVIFSRNVSNSCFSGMQITYDYQMGGNAQDFLELVYSTDNGATWNAIGGPLTSATWATQTSVLPAALNNASFRIGFRFTYDNSIVSGNAPAIDNVFLEGMTADATPPSIVCPASFNIYADASCQATVPDLPPSITKTDNCTATSDLVINQSPAIGSMVSGNTTATMIVTDQAGNQATCNIPLNFIDTVSPAVTCPPAATAIANNDCEHTIADYTSGASATDNCSSTVFVQTPTPGTAIPGGVNTITIAAVDIHGNEGTCQFTLTVADTTAPVLVCPTYHLVPANTLCQGHVGNLDGVAVVTDNCSPGGLLSFSQVPGETFTFTDTMQATIYVSDAEGNIGSCIVNVVAADTVAPVITCLSDTTVATVNPCDLTIPDLSAEYTATDACTPSGPFTFEQFPAAGTTATGMITVMTTITDPFGNEAYCYTNVRPNDVTPATVTCPADQTINNGTNCSYTLPNYTGLVTVNDNCPFYGLVQTPPAGATIGSGTNTITMIVTDAGQNISSCTFTVTVNESVPPAIICPPAISTCDAEVTYSAPNGSDNCLFAITQTDASGLTSGSVFPEGITTQTYTITDSSGNTASCSFTIEILDNPDPAVITVDSIEMCNIFTTPVSASAVTPGTGSWQVLTGAGTFADATSNSTTVSGLSAGTNELIWTVTSEDCGSVHDTLVVIASPLPSQANVQDTMLYCAGSGQLLQASTPTAGVGTWSNATGIQFDDVHAPITTISNVNGGTHIVVWTVNSGTCPSSSDSMVLITPGYAMIDQPDTVLCESDLPWFLSGSAPQDDQSVIWTTITGETSLSSKYMNEIYLNAASIGSVVLVYNLSHPVCGSSSDTLELFIQACDGLISDIPTLFTPNADGKNDYFDVPNLGYLYPGCRVEIYNRWGGLVFESDGYALPWDGTFKGEEVPMGTYFYHIDLNNEAGDELDGAISILR